MPKRFRIPHRGEYTASGQTIVTTAPDLAKWLMMFRNRGQHDGEIHLFKKTIAEMFKGVRKGPNCRGELERDIIGFSQAQTGGNVKPIRLGLEKSSMRA